MRRRRPCGAGLPASDQRHDHSISYSRAYSRHHRAGDAAAAELHHRLVHGDQQGGGDRSRRRGPAAPEGHRRAGPHAREDLDHPWPYGPCRGGCSAEGRHRRADRGTAQGRPVLDRAYRRGRPSVRHAGRAHLHSRPLARGRRCRHPRRNPLRGAPLPASPRWGTCCSRGR